MWTSIASCSQVQPGMTFTLKHFDQLRVHELYQILALREQVFLVGQQIIEPDLDGVDQQCYFLFCGEPVHAALRVLPPEIKGYPSVGRVAVAEAARAQGLGKAMMRASIDACERLWPGQKMKISAQAYLEKFYNDLGFEKIGQPYEEAGIPHLLMKQIEHSL